MTAVSTGAVVAAVTFVLTYAFYMLGLWRGRREQADLRLGLYRTALDEVAKANRRANKYRLAWVSARHRSVCGFPRIKCPVHGVARRRA